MFEIYSFYLIVYAYRLISIMYYALNYLCKKNLLDKIETL